MLFKTRTYTFNSYVEATPSQVLEAAKSTDTDIAVSVVDGKTAISFATNEDKSAFWNALDTLRGRRIVVSSIFEEIAVKKWGTYSVEVSIPANYWAVCNAQDLINAIKKVTDS